MTELQMYEKQLKSLVRERQRLWSMYIQSCGDVRIMLDTKDGRRCELRSDVCFPHILIDKYCLLLEQRIAEVLRYISVLRKPGVPVE